MTGSQLKMYDPYLPVKWSSETEPTRGPAMQVDPLVANVLVPVAPEHMAYLEEAT